MALLKKDNQQTFSELAEPLAKMLENGEATKIVKVPSDGNWFKVSFDAVELNENRLVIAADREDNSLQGERYIVSFKDTKAAYLYGMYNHRHTRFGWSYLSWDIRAYTQHPQNASARVYMHGFRAQNEIKRMIHQMEIKFGTKNTLNTYINDNLTRFQLGIKTGKTPEQIERQSSNGTMESLGYKFVEPIDIGHIKGKWDKVAVHWFKHDSDRAIK